jgi:hypothetical protein
MLPDVPQKVFVGAHNREFIGFHRLIGALEYSEQHYQYPSSHD